MHPVFTQKRANGSDLRISRVFPNTTKLKTMWQFYFSVQWKPQQEGSHGGKWRGMFRLLDYIATRNADSSQYRDRRWIINSRFVIILSVRLWSFLRSDWEIVYGQSFSGGKSNATPKNSHPLSWEGTMLLLLDVQGSVRERLLVLTKMRAREQQLACVPKALPVPPPS